MIFITFENLKLYNFAILRNRISIKQYQKLIIGWKYIKLEFRKGIPFKFTS